MNHDPGIGEGVTPLMPLSALSVSDILYDIAERRRGEKLYLAFSALEVEESTVVQLGKPLVPGTFRRTFEEREYTFVATAYEVEITRTK